MIILGIETSCDETAAAVLEQSNGRIQILSNVIASSASLQAKYGGIIPEQAAREQLKSIIPVIEEALRQAFPSDPSIGGRVEGSISTDPNKQIATGRHFDPRNDTINKIDAIAVTYGPGLIGSLLVGVETAKTLALLWNKPLIPVNHLLGHFYANWIVNQNQEARIKNHGKNHNSYFMIHDSIPYFPCIGLLVSGGHTDLVLFKDHDEYEYLGGTRDDAAGECFDKCARILGLPYPGGPEISKLASQGQTLQGGINLPSPMINSKDFDFSFSGLKTAVASLVSNHFVIPVQTGIQETKSRSELDPGIRRDDKKTLTETDKANICASIEKAIVDVLVEKTIAAAQKHNVEQIIIAGGVAANKKLKQDLRFKIQDLGIKLHIPEPALCTDNAAMIASRAFFEKPIQNPTTLQANPNLSL